MATTKKKKTTKKKTTKKKTTKRGKKVAVVVVGKLVSR